ncbi:HD domain-containing protein [Bacillus sp. FJAT-49732]|uniref:HD domain-containing protein n=1 Tax=Lederbergia citrisecunda TaxID=2833583 RepID=A0A942TM62_9BACI|nr:HD domain-containing protein [Lederbergia citrisecunda]MBS4199242.1 HD domain-containing protein [Lederbergia citrisecunda]
MKKNEIISTTEKFVYEQLHDDASGHDWWHIHRVTNIAKNIAAKEKADIFLCEMAALLHDIADEKLNISEEEGINKVRDFLLSINVDEEYISKIMEIITTMSFKGGGQPPMKTLEGMIVQDADRLDAMGAIGIARTFAYSGSKNQLIYHPDIKPVEKLDPEQYRKRKSTAINHFYEKLFKLKDLMNTEMGKKMAESRHQYMKDYIETFFNEWELE